MTRPEDWTRHLMPDPLVGRRLRRTIGAAADELLARRREDWWQVASRWAGILAPIGVAATLAFAALAVGSGADAARDGGIVASNSGDDVFEILRTETAPVGFASGPDDAAVVFAAIEAAERRPDAGADSAVAKP